MHDNKGLCWEKEEGMSGRRQLVPCQHQQQEHGAGNKGGSNQLHQTPGMHESDLSVK